MRFLTCLVVLALSAIQTSAAPITFVFTMDVTSALGPSLGYTAGDSLSGAFTFESTTKDGTLNPTFGAYNDAILSVSTPIGTTAVGANLIYNNHIQVFNDFFAPGLYIDGVAYKAVYLPVDGNLVLRSFNLSLISPKPTANSAVTTDLLPLVPYDLALFALNEVSLAFEDRRWNPHGSTTFLSGRVVRLELAPDAASVPDEATTFSLLLSACGSVLLLRRRVTS